MKVFAIVIIISFTWLESSCQIIVPEVKPALDHRIFINLGLEPELITTLGYVHLMGQPSEGTHFYLGASFKFAPLAIQQIAWRVNISPTLDHQFSSKWKGVITNDFYLVHNKNRASAMNGLGFELSTAMLHYGEKWTKGFQMGWQRTAFTHIKHSDETKSTFDDRYVLGNGSGPTDGWFGGTASRFRLGFLASRSMGDRMNIQFGLGSLISFQKQGLLLSFAHAQVPIYFNAQLVYGLNRQ